MPIANQLHGAGIQEDMSDEYASPADEMEEGRRRRLTQDDDSEDDPAMEAPAGEYGMRRKLQEVGWSDCYEALGMFRAHCGGHHQRLVP